MIHYFNGKIIEIGDNKILTNEFFGIDIIYNGNKTEGEFYLHFQLDTNNHTNIYYAFENMEQKRFFSQLTRIPGVGSKTAYNICSMPYDELYKAVEDFDIKYFQSIPGIGPKSGKRILLELKNSIGKNDINKINIDENLLKNIVKTLNNLGYEQAKIKKILLKCPLELKEKNLSKIIKWILNNISND